LALQARKVSGAFEKRAPGLSMQIENMVVNCSSCAKDRHDPKEPLISTSFPSHQWERLAVDLFELVGKVYLIVVDYYSRQFEIWGPFLESPKNFSGL